VIVCADPDVTVGGTLGAAFTIIETFDELLNPLLSVAVSLKTYVPVARPVMVVERFVADVIVDAPPLTSLQSTLLIVAPLFPAAVPVRVTVLTGNVMVCAEPDVTVGGTLGAAFTVIVTVDELLNPLSSEGVNL
jgi:hypothetical protein